VLIADVSEHFIGSRGLGCVGYLYRTGFKQVGDGTNGKVTSRLGVVRKGEVYKACAGGITDRFQNVQSATFI
jgi:hypothetical protein